MKSLVQALPLLLVGGVVAHASCADSSATGDTTVNVTVNNPPEQACNEGSPDGFCNALGDNPETCECFDCVETAYCLDACNDNNVCDGAEDGTCIDCFEASTDNTGAGNEGGSPPEGGAPMGGMGGAPGTTASTSSASTASATTGVGGAGGVGGI